MGTGYEGGSVEAELTALAATAVTALTGLMVTESWEQAKLRLAGWFRRRGEDENVGVFPGIPDSPADEGVQRWPQGEEQVGGEEAAQVVVHAFSEHSPVQAYP